MLENKNLFEEKLGIKISSSEEALLDELSSKIDFNEKPVEVEPTEEETTEEEIRKQKDCKEEHIRPTENNPFNNISKTILSSESIGKKMVFDYEYTELERDGRIVGHEGGIAKKTIVDFSSKVDGGEIEKIGKMDAIKDRINKQ